MWLNKYSVAWLLNPSITQGKFTRDPCLKAPADEQIGSLEDGRSLSFSGTAASKSREAWGRSCTSCSESMLCIRVTSYFMSVLSRKMVGSVGCVKLARAAILKILVCLTIEAAVVRPLHALRLFSAERHRHQRQKSAHCVFTWSLCYTSMKGSCQHWPHDARVE